MRKRSFELFELDLNLLNVFGALQCAEDAQTNKYSYSCSFSYEQSLMLSRITKRNTILFDQLTDLLQLKYTVSDDVYPDFLYECILVDFHSVREKDIFCFLDKKKKGIETMSAAELKQFLYQNGFTITGVPARFHEPDNKKRPARKGAYACEDIHYRPFVASASMARKSQLLFVNETHYQELMERLTLGFFTCDSENRLRMPTKEEPLEGVYFDQKFSVSPAKVSAYIGLMLSDGVSLRELEAVWSSRHKPNAASLPVLNEKTVFVADDLILSAEDTRKLYQDLGPYAWVIEDSVCTLSQGSRKAGEKDAVLIRLFRSFKSRAALKEQSKSPEWTEALKAWRELVVAYLDGTDGKKLEYDNPLPAPVEDDNAFSSHLDRFAFLWSFALFAKASENNSGSKPQTLKEALENKITELKDSGGAVFDTLKNLICPETPVWFTCSICGSDSEQRACAKHGDDLLCAAFPADRKLVTTKLQATNDPNWKPEINLFDGIGLADPETFGQLEKLLLGTEQRRDPSRFTALIIRLPWIKGLLVECDFQRFFRSKQPDLSENARIKDVFGKDRDLSQVRIILTKSMLKGFKYLQYLRQENGGENWDLWQYYWSKINDAAHPISLLLTGWNSEPAMRAKMNYQFLSTSGLPDAVFQNICVEAAQELASYLDESNPNQAVFFTGREDTAEDTGSEESTEPDVPEELTEPSDNGEDSGAAPSDEGGEQTQTSEPDDGSGDAALTAAEMRDTNAIFGLALCAQQKNLKEGEKAPLLSTRYAKSELQSYVCSGLIDAMKGRVPVKGDYRFVAPDLVAMLYFLFNRYVSETKELKLHSKINQNAPSGHGYFYAPGARTPWDADSNLAVLRNPHYAVGEAALVKPLPAADQAEYKEWFGDLSSVIMLPATAVAAMGGADYDGDRCLCVAEARIVSAIKGMAQKSTADLQYMMDNRESYLSQLGAIKNTNVQEASHIRAYADVLKEWLQNPGFIPKKEEKTGRFKEDCCPPLIFGDPNAKAINIHPDDDGIEEHLYAAFSRSSQQRIGLMSLEALRFAGRAYRQRPAPEVSDGGTAESAAQNAVSGEAEKLKPLTEDQLTHLEDWLWHWRVVSLALENGCEIDMAKTGVKCEAPEMRKKKTLFNPYQLENKKKRPSSPNPILSAVTDQLCRLEECPPSTLGTFRKLEKCSGLRKRRGRAFSKMLLEKMTFGGSIIERSQQEKKKPHNNVNLFPYQMYLAMLNQMKTEEKMKLPGEANPSSLRLPLPSVTGESLPSYLWDSASFPAGGPGGEESGGTEQAKGNGTEPNCPQQPTPMGKLVWASNQERQSVLKAFLEDYRDADSMGEPLDAARYRELYDCEQGIYFLKEAAKYLRMAEMASISNGKRKTPAGLAEKLKTIFQDSSMRLQYLCQYRERISGELSETSKPVMNDHLFLTLAAEAFVEQVGKSGEVPPGDLPPEKAAAANEAMLAFAGAKRKRAEQGELHTKLLKRYEYCMRNLQQRYSLAESLEIMENYTKGYAKSPLAEMGIPAENLKALYMKMEEG